MNDSTYADGIRRLISMGMERGYVTHEDIHDCVPACTQSKSLLDEVVRLMVSDAHVDVFESTPSEEERRQGPNALANADFVQGASFLLPPDG